MEFDKDSFHRFHSYMDNLNKPEQFNIRKFFQESQASVDAVSSDLNESDFAATTTGGTVLTELLNTRRIRKITHAEIMGEEIINEKQKVRKNDTIPSTKTVQDVNLDASIHIDLTNKTNTAHIDLQENSTEITSNMSQPNVLPESTDANVHVHLSKSTNTVLSGEGASGADEPDAGLESKAKSSSDQPKCMDSTNTVLSGEATSDADEPDTGLEPNAKTSSDQSKRLDSTDNCCCII